MPHRSVIIDPTNGSVLADLSTVGGSDEVWFNAGDNRYYGGESALQNLGIIDATSLTAVGEVQAGLGSHTVAALTWPPIICSYPSVGPIGPAPTAASALDKSVNVENEVLSRQF